MNRLFGRKKDTQKPTLEDASVKISARCDAVDARVSKIDAELAKLKECIQRTTGATQQRHKQRAIQLLQQKRLYQNQQDVLMQQQFNIDQLQFTTESVKDAKLQVDAMKDATKTLKREFKKMSVADVEKLQDELLNLYEDAQYVQEAMGRSYDIPDSIDEDEMLGELEALAMQSGNEADSSYLSDALAMPSGRLPDLMSNTQQQQETETPDPYKLETQLGL
ncbi:SNF-7-like protein, putative [Trypanosoma brucei gambiense DAL972]|uniref:SNF-7-like protein, putative n=1 Tax=Trypanosoma brucei gambiense (strain MHOM/CI/86/DAL972) TaxID=679716 RepID=D0A2A0_TRYB9|nr:SNF-7-like protein, putative [Trypanosoma brucei gambiense DAL972]CBH15394.1 SNF-7-like protein, putative [Trypanosoma brucei gambiense DAL972]|eukprot:XP_011777658.1 SNF-7-like protein, putative [Trypanosoma brucei gambiense DAL972]